MLKMIGRETLQPFYWQLLWWLLSWYSLLFKLEGTMIQKLRILTLALVALFLLFASGVLVEWRLPGNNDWTDQDMVIAYGFGLFSAVLWLGFVVNNTFFLFRGHWPRFRRYALIASVVLPLGSYIIRPIVVQLSYGTKVAEYIELQDSFHTLISPYIPAVSSFRRPMTQPITLKTLVTPNGMVMFWDWNLLMSPAVTWTTSMNWSIGFCFPMVRVCLRWGVCLQNNYLHCN